MLCLLRCPLSGQRLRRASAEDRGAFPGWHLEEALLIREDGQVAYRMQDGIPLLIPEEAIQRIAHAP